MQIRLRQLRGWLVRLFGLFHRKRREREFAEELESHLALHIADNLRAGLSPQEARRQAHIKLGGVTRTQELHREQGGLPMLETLLQDLRFGARMLRKNPGFSLIAILTLALGIGANTAIFSVVDAALLRALPYPDAERLVMLWTGQGVSRSGSALPDYREWRDQSRVFEGLGAFYYGDFNLVGEGHDPERVQGAFVTANFFPTLGVAPALGREFRNEEEQFGQHRVALLSHELWQRRYGGDPQLVGREIRLGNGAYTVVGVMPEGMAFLGNSPRPELWTPLAFAPGDNMATRNNHFLRAVGRLKAGVSREQAQTEVNAVAQRIATQLPGNAGSGEVVALREQLVGGIRRALLVLLGAVAFVLLVACVNVANLLLARAAARERELAVRMALGASRTRIIRQLLLENAPLAVLGGATGLLLAWWGMKLLSSSLPATLPRFNAIRMDGRVLVFTLLASMLTVVLFGLLPALQTARAGAPEALNEGGRGGTAGRRRSRLRSALVVIEMALALVLLIGAGLMMRSFVRLQGVETGFIASNVLTMRIPLPVAKYPGPQGPNSPPAGLNFFLPLLERLAALPGVESASFSTILPLGYGSSGREKNLSIEGRPAPPSLNQVPSVGFALVSPDYFKTLGITMRRGRGFTPFDRAEAQPVAIINETLAQRFFPNEDPLGKTVWLGPPESLLPPEALIPVGGRFVRRTIVGVIGDVKGGNLEAGANAEAYVPLEQYRGEAWNNALFLAVRSPLPTDSLTAAIREQVRALDREQPLTSLATMEERLSSAFAQPRFHALLLGLFAGVALLLAAIGIYGVMSYAVTQRTPEIGIRLALGARTVDVLRLVIGQGMKLALGGVLLGLGGALALTRLLKTLLFGVSATDPLTFAVIALLLTAVALLACYLPARRATKVDPMIALRRE